MVLKQLPIADKYFHTQVLTGYAHEIADMSWLHIQRFLSKLESQNCCELNTLQNIEAGGVYYKMDTDSATVGSEEKKLKMLLITPMRFLATYLWQRLQF